MYIILRVEIINYFLFLLFDERLEIIGVSYQLLNKRG